MMRHLLEGTTQSLKSFPCITPQIFLSDSFLHLTTHHLSKENNAKLFNGLINTRSCYGKLRNWVCMDLWFKVQAESPTPSVRKFSWSH